MATPKTLRLILLGLLLLAACSRGDNTSAISEAFARASFEGGKTTFSVEGPVCLVTTTTPTAPTNEGVIALISGWPSPESIFEKTGCDVIVIRIIAEAEGVRQEVTLSLGRCEGQPCETGGPKIAPLPGGPL